MISATQKDRLTHLFHLFDADRRGTVTAADFEAIAARLAARRSLRPGSLEYAYVHSASTSLWEHLKASDADRNAEISLDEWLEYFSRLCASPRFPVLLKAQCDVLYNLLDTNSDGAIGADEYVSLLSAYGVPEERARQNFPSLDANGDGHLSQDELFELMKEFYLSDDPSARGARFWALNDASGPSPTAASKPRPAPTPMIKSSEIPALECPFPSAVNPGAAAAHEHSLAWARRFELTPKDGAEYDALRAAKGAWYIAHTMPDAGADDLFLASDWIVWLLLHDDVVDASPTGRDPARLTEQQDRYAAILRGAELRADDIPAARAIADLRDRFRQRADPWWFERIITEMEQQFQSQLWEATINADTITPDLATYVKMRPYTYVVSFTCACIAKGIPPRARFLENAYIIELTRMALNQAAWVNDILGVNREVREGSPHNLVTVLAGSRGCTLAEALPQSAAMTNAETRAFVGLAERLPSLGGETGLARDYISALGSWMRGHLDWYNETARYPF
jgi:5-epi-alpha-selinene synthase